MSSILAVTDLSLARKRSSRAGPILEEVESGESSDINDDSKLAATPTAQASRSTIGLQVIGKRFGNPTTNRSIKQRPIAPLP